MSLDEALARLKETGLSMDSWDETRLLWHLQQANPFTVTVGEYEGRYFATTSSSREAWEDTKGVTHPAIDNSEHYVYGESPEEAAANLLVQQIDKFNHNLHTLSFKKA